MLVLFKPTGKPRSDLLNSQYIVLAIITTDRLGDTLRGCRRQMQKKKPAYVMRAFGFILYVKVFYFLTHDPSAA